VISNCLPGRFFTLAARYLIRIFISCNINIVASI
jgi:hypothetical protein